MFCSVNDSACLEISLPGVGTDAIDLPAALKNISNAFSACSMVFSANSRSSAGTSSFGSIMLSSSGFNGALPHFQNGVFALFAPGGFGITNLFRGIQRSSSGCTQTQGAASCLLLPLARRVPKLDQGRGPAFQVAGDHCSPDRICISTRAIVCNVLGLLSPCFALRRMLSAMFRTRVELTGCGSVATAPSSASSIALINSGENEAFDKSFIRRVRFRSGWIACKDKLPAGRMFPTCFGSRNKSRAAVITPGRVPPNAPRQVPTDPQQG